MTELPRNQFSAECCKSTKYLEKARSAPLQNCLERRRSWGKLPVSRYCGVPCTEGAGCGRSHAHSQSWMLRNVGVAEASQIEWLQRGRKTFLLCSYNNLYWQCLTLYELTNENYLKDPDPTSQRRKWRANLNWDNKQVTGRESERLYKNFVSRKQLHYIQRSI